MIVLLVLLTSTIPVYIPLQFVGLPDILTAADAVRGFAEALTELLNATMAGPLARQGEVHGASLQSPNSQGAQTVAELISHQLGIGGPRPILPRFSCVWMTAQCAAQVQVATRLERTRLRRPVHSVLQPPRNKRFKRLHKDHMRRPRKFRVLPLAYTVTPLDVYTQNYFKTLLVVVV